MKRSTSKAPVSSARSTLRKSIVDYQESLRQRDLAPSTLTTYNRGLRNFLAFLENEGCRFITDIRSEHLIRFRVWARERSKPYRIRHASSGEGAATTYAQAARGWCHWLYRTDQLLLDPCARLAPDSRSRRIPRALTHQEVETLLEVIKVEDPVSLRDQAILDLLYSSGLRVGELCALDLADLDLAQNEALVRQSKSGHPRQVPVGEVAHDALDRYLEEGRPAILETQNGTRTSALFVSARGKRLLTTVVGRLVSRWAEIAGIEGRVTPHTLRHTAAVHLLLGGASVVHVQAFLGHRSLDSTAHYTRLVIDDLKRTHARSHPRETGRV